MRRTHELIDDDAQPSSPDDEWTVELITPPSRFPVIARVGIGVAIFLVIAVAAIAIVPRVLPESVTAGAAERLIRDVVGVDVEIRGDHSFSLLPNVAISARDVIRRVPDGMTTDFSVQSIDVELSAWSLMTGSIRVQQFEMLQPSWTLLSERPETGETPPIERSWGIWRDMRVGDFRIENGSVDLANVFADRPLVLRSFNIALEPPEDGSVVTGINAKGDAVLNGEPISIRISTEDPRLLVNGNRWPFQVKLASRLMDAVVEGSLSLRQQMQGDISARVSGSDDRAAKAWFGLGEAASPQSPSRGFRASSTIEIADGSVTANGIRADFGQTDIGGSLTVARGADGANEITGILTSANIDVSADTLFHFAALAGKMPKGAITWSWRDAVIFSRPQGPGSVQVERVASDGGVVIRTDGIQIAGGSVRGNVTIDRAEGMQALHILGSATRLSADELLGGLSDIDPPVSGLANVSVDFFTVGADPQQLREALSGTAELIMSDGYIAVPLVDDPAAFGGRTAFLSLNGRFDVSRGVAVSEDLLLRGDGVSIVGAGRLDITTGSVEFDVQRYRSDAPSSGRARLRVSGQPDNLRVENVN